MPEFLSTLLISAPCDFCADGKVQPVYRDPETGCLYCLTCLELSTQEWEELPPDPAIVQMARKIVAESRLGQSSKQGENDHARN